MKSKTKLNDYLRKHWFLVGIVGSIFLAGIYPSFGAKNGPLKPEVSVKFVAVSVIFLISGLSLKTDSVFATFQQYKLHLFIQLFTFIFVPVFVQSFVAILGVFGVDKWILKGLITVACMPPPVSSAVILTRSVQGNEIAAIFNSVVGSFLGILITPVSLLLNLGYTTIVPLFGTVLQLTLTVLLPLFMGQSIRKFTSFRGYKWPLNTIGQCSLLFIIYTTYCDTFSTPEVALSAADVLITIFLVVLIQMLLLTTSFFVANCYKKTFPPADVVAIVFCSTHKSLTLGIPILRIMFHGYAHLSQISLPLLVYHPTQIILGGLLVSQLKDWVQLDKNKRPPV